MTIYGRVADVASRFLRELLPSSFMRHAHRPALYRIQAILARLVNGQRVTAPVLAEILEVSTRTVARDLDYMINTLHVPIAFDYSKKSYILIGPVSIMLSLPPDFTNLDSSGELAHRIVLLVDHSLEPQLSSLILHPTQKLFRNADNRLCIELTVRISEPLVHWILSFGGRLSVDSPDVLRKRVRQAAQRILDDAS
ncbi:MAG: WYL domain-containing protein [Candidatus Kapabacteria bacterium]|nr:WYL domain-containing protein [Candidatus Kapabacteria bacterium]